MEEITITGASDDLIEIDGAIREEFNWYQRDEEEKGYLAFSDGTILSVKFDGLWRIHLVVKGGAEFSRVEGIESEDAFDIVTLRGDIEWVLFGHQVALRAGKESQAQGQGGGEMSEKLSEKIDKDRLEELEEMKEAVAAMEGK